MADVTLTGPLGEEADVSLDTITEPAEGGGVFTRQRMRLRAVRPPASPPPPAVILPTPVQYYPLSGDLSDASGNGRHGTASGGSPTFTSDGKFGAGARGRFTAESVVAGTSIPAARTLMAWVKRVGTGGVTLRLGNESEGAFSLNLHDDGNVQVYATANFFSSTASGQVVRAITGSWDHFAVAIGEAGAVSAKVYMNGELINTVSLSGVEFDVFSNPAVFLVGGDASVGGWIDEVAHFAAAIPSADIATVAAGEYTIAQLAGLS